MTDLQELRRQIDEIDDVLVDLFQRRMDVSADIARYKHENSMPVYDPARERQKLEDLTRKAKDADYIAALYSLIFELSRAVKERILNPEVN
jgi:chorismate mutase/prephenate dehydratase